MDLTDSANSLLKVPYYYHITKIYMVKGSLSLIALVALMPVKLDFSPG